MMKMLRPFTSIIILATTLALGSCTTPMVASFEASSGARIACDDSQGGYRLPRRTIVMQVTPSVQGRGFEATARVGKAFGEAGDPICLKYINSLTSEDNLAISVNTLGLLQKIETTAIDKSNEIILKAVETGAILATGGRTSGFGSLPQTLSLEFDPFDGRWIGRINRDLRAYGLCVFIDEYHVDGATSPAEWCDRGGRPAAQPRTRVSKAAAVVSVSPPEERRRHGILYRPNMPHAFVVMQKIDPGRGPWQLASRQVLEMPNVSPVLSLSVDRTFFATRTTKITFADGVLTNVEIDKTSELLTLSQTLLDAANRIVAIPAQIVQFRIDRATGQTRLIAAQNQLIVNYKNYLETYARLFPSANAPDEANVSEGTPLSGTQRSATFDKNRRDFLNECRSTNRESFECDDLWERQQVRPRP
jgi:hypothetical protein